MHEHAGVPDQPITQITRIILTSPDPEKLRAERELVAARSAERYRITDESR